MLTLTCSVLCALAEPTAVADLQRFPSPELANAAIARLIDQRYRLKQQLPTAERDLRLAANAEALDAWELLVDLQETETDQERLLVLTRLRQQLGERDYETGRMPR